MGLTVSQVLQSSVCSDLPDSEQKLAQWMSQVHTKYIPSTYQVNTKYIPSEYQVHTKYIPSTYQVNTDRRTNRHTDRKPVKPLLVIGESL